MLQWIRSDLHLHTCLSPCGDLTMSPKRIVEEALRHEINAIAITDHNSAENTPAALKAASGTGLVVFPGMEVCTQEEIHVVAIFDSLDNAFGLQSHVYSHLKGMNNPGIFGLQVVANENDEVEGTVDRLLIGATDLPLEEVVSAIHRLNGIAIAAHIDRESYSVFSQLGFIPETPSFDALEISENISDADAQRRFRDYRQHAFIRNSDAHGLDRLGCNTTRYLIGERTLDELRMAFRCERGRQVSLKSDSTSHQPDR